MKKREINPIGPFVIEYLIEHASCLYEYLLKKKPNEELVAKDLTVISTSISMPDLFFIGMIVLITGWWIMTFSCIEMVCWIFIMGLMCQQNKGNFVT